MYIDGFVLPVPKGKLKEYGKLARLARKTWLKHGALQYVECVHDDTDPCGTLDFAKLMKAKEAETVIFAFVVYKSKAHRAKVVEGVTGDPAMIKAMSGELPFELKRMAAGGFKGLVG